MADDFPAPRPSEPPLAAPPPRGGNRTAVVLAAVVAVVALLAVVGYAVRDDEPDAPTPGFGQTVSCGAVVDVPAATDAPAHRNGRIEYDEAPPSSGDHNPMPLPGVIRVARPDTEDVVERAVHNLEHGYVVLWFDQSLTDEDTVRAALDGVTQRKVIAVPWDRGGMSTARPYVLAAWGHTQDCTVLSATAVNAFYAEHGGENGDAPEKSAP